MATAQALSAGLVVTVAVLSACTQTTRAQTGEPQPATEPKPERVEVRPQVHPPKILPLAVRVSGNSVKVGGELLSDDPSVLRRAIRRNRREKQSALVAVAAESSSQTVAAVLNALEAAKIDEVELIVGVESAVLRLASEPDIGTALVLDGRTRPAIGLWFLPASAPVAWSPGNAASDEAIAGGLDPLCKDACQVNVWTRASTSVEQLFGALRVLARWHERLPGVQLHLALIPPKMPGTDESGKPVGAIPPEVIQSVVRAGFRAFRSCYHDGLEKDRGLTGSVKVRFVIDQQGKVSSVTDEGSDIPDDAVRDCVLKAFRQLVFPAPEGGIVTVVYPLVFAPDDRSSVIPK